MIGWLRHQKRAFAAASKRLYAHPVATLLTALAMGVAISLPGALYLGLGTLDRLAGDLPAQPEISIYLDNDASSAQKKIIAARLRQPDIAQARYVPRDEALAALSAAQDLTGITAGLQQNPLPDAWVVRTKTTSRETLTRVAADLEKLPGVMETHVDSLWAERLQAALVIGRIAVWLLAGLFAIALVAISGNAIRAQVLARRDEIVVSRLIGATHRYIRRPFLFVGALQGLLGGLAAGGVLAIAGTILHGPVQRLAGLYGSDFLLLAPAATEMIAVLGITILSSWLGAWISVTHALHQIETAR